MRDSIKLGLTACTLFVAASSAASAADVLVGNYTVSGYTTASNCKVAGTPQKGQASNATVVYPGAGKAGMILANPATTASTAAGSGATQVCVASGAVPAAGLNNATISFKCYSDTETKDSSLATITSKFTIGPSQTPQVHTVKVVTSIPVLGCSFTTEGTYSHN